MVGTAKAMVLGAALFTGIVALSAGLMSELSPAGDASASGDRDGPTAVANNGDTHADGCYRECDAPPKDDCGGCASDSEAQTVIIINNQNTNTNDNTADSNSASDADGTGTATADSSSDSASTTEAKAEQSQGQGQGQGQGQEQAQSQAYHKEFTEYAKERNSQAMDWAGEAPLPSLRP